MSAKNQLFLILDQKEIFWRQCSKQLWLQAGEKNTKYFHASCNSSRRTNMIQRLKDYEGHCFDWENGLHELIKRYYQQLFTATSTHEEFVLDCIPRTVIEEQNDQLLSPVTDGEV